jgi:pilus assembly protein FimV
MTSLLYVVFAPSSMYSHIPQALVEELGLEGEEAEDLIKGLGQPKLEAPDFTGAEKPPAAQEAPVTQDASVTQEAPAAQEQTLTKEEPVLQEKPASKEQPAANAQTVVHEQKETPTHEEVTEPEISKESIKDV